MPKTIKCSNPSCNSLIPVPDGVAQVICDNCNTWHFPSNDEVGNDDFQTAPSTENGYGAPPSYDNSFSNQDATPPYVPPSFPEEQNNYGYQEPDPQPLQEPVAPIEMGGDLVVAYLVTDSGVRLGLKEGINIIGRKNADLIIEDRTISRRHCVVETSSSPNGGYNFFICDIGHMEGKASTNGVFVSGRSLRLQDYERVPIQNGSSIRIGNVNLLLQLG